MMLLLTELAKINNFIALRKRDDAFTRFTYSEAEEQEIAEELDEVEQAMSYSEHTNWIDFSKYNLAKPIYINLVRHPIQKAMSAYYFVRRPEVFEFYRKNYNRTVDEKEYFEMSFNDCVKQAKRSECIFDSRNKYRADWRVGVLHFCGNKRVCRYVGNTYKIIKSY